MGFPSLSLVSQEGTAAAVPADDPGVRDLRDPSGMGTVALLLVLRLRPPTHRANQLAVPGAGCALLGGRPCRLMAAVLCPNADSRTTSPPGTTPWPPTFWPFGDLDIEFYRQSRHAPFAGAASHKAASCPRQRKRLKLYAGWCLRCDVARTVGLRDALCCRPSASKNRLLDPD